MEQLLLRTGDALISGDFDSFLACFHLPHRIELYDGTNYLESANDLRSVFDANRTYFERIGVTKLVRICVESAFIDPETITTTHQSRLLRENELLQEPYPVYSVVKWIDGAWKITHGKYAIADSDAHNAALAAKAAPGASSSGNRDPEA